MIPTDVLDQMMIDIMNGQTTPPSDVQGEQREVWEKLAVQIAEIRDEGGIVEIPGEIP